MEATTNKTFTLDWSLLASERRSSGWLIGDDAPRTEPLRVLLAVLDINLRRELALVLRIDGHEVIEAEDPVSPQRYVDGLQPPAAIDVLICGTALSAEGSKIRNPGGLIVIGRNRKKGCTSTLVSLSAKSLMQDKCDLAQVRRCIRDHREIS